MKRDILLFALIISLFTFAGCGKYEEGPEFTLLTKKMRITGEWKQVKEIYNGMEKIVPNNTWDILKNGKIEQIYIINDSEQIETHTWEFSVKKENFIINKEGKDPDEYIILKLTNKEFWVQLVTPTNEEVLYYFVKQD